MAVQKAPSRFDTLLSMIPLKTTIKARQRSPVMVVGATHSGAEQDTGLSPTAISPSDTNRTFEDDRSPTLIVDDNSPTDTDWSHKPNLGHPPPALHHAVSFELSGTVLFDNVRERFRGGIATLDNLLRYMERSGPARCRGYRRGIDLLLENLVAMARWLVGFLESAKSVDGNSGWTRSAVVGLRVDLHQYSWKVMKLTMLLKKVGAYDGP